MCGLLYEQGHTEGRSVQHVYKGGKKAGSGFCRPKWERATLSIGGKQYTMLIRDDYSRFVCLYFLHAKSDAAEAFKKYLADIRADGTP
ncbi:unnamed protein product, partial [Choristocarpus tenellus]